MNEKDEKTTLHPQPEKVEVPVPRKIRGVMTIFKEDDMEFRAERSTGISTQSVIKQQGKSKVYQTVGDKKNNYVAHLVVDKDDPDPASTMADQLEKLTKDMQPKRIPKARGRRLLDDKNVQVVFSKTSKKIDIHMNIDIAETPNYNQSLMNLMYKINQCFATNTNLLTSARS